MLTFRYAKFEISMGPESSYIQEAVRYNNLKENGNRGVTTITSTLVIEIIEDIRAFYHATATVQSNYTDYFI